MTWAHGFFEQRGLGTIVSEEDRGRRYFVVRVNFPPLSGWWPRSTETSSLKEARDWIDEQDADWQAHRLKSVSGAEVSIGEENDV